MPPPAVRPAGGPAGAELRVPAVIAARLLLMRSTPPAALHIAACLHCAQAWERRRLRLIPLTGSETSATRPACSAQRWPSRSSTCGEPHAIRGGGTSAGQYLAPSRGTRAARAATAAPATPTSCPPRWTTPPSPGSLQARGKGGAGPVCRSGSLLPLPLTLCVPLTLPPAETLKYLYLLFSPDSSLDLTRFVLNTEAHPLKVSTTAVEGGGGGSSTTA